jgi:hypothetical protein
MEAVRLPLNIPIRATAGVLQLIGFVVGSASNKAYNGAHLADEDDVVVVGIKSVSPLIEW